MILDFILMVFFGMFSSMMLVYFSSISMIDFFLLLVVEVVSLFFFVYFCSTFKGIYFFVFVFFLSVFSHIMMYFFFKDFKSTAVCKFFFFFFFMVLICFSFFFGCCSDCFLPCFSFLNQLHFYFTVYISYLLSYIRYCFYYYFSVIMFYIFLLIFYFLISFYKWLVYFFMGGDDDSGDLDCLLTYKSCLATLDSLVELSERLYDYMLYIFLLWIVPMVISWVWNAFNTYVCLCGDPATLYPVFDYPNFFVFFMCINQLDFSIKWVPTEDFYFMSDYYLVNIFCPYFDIFEKFYIKEMYVAAIFFLFLLLIISYLMKAEVYFMISSNEDSFKNQIIHKEELSFSIVMKISDFMYEPSLTVLSFLEKHFINILFDFFTSTYNSFLSFFKFIFSLVHHYFEVFISFYLYYYSSITKPFKFMIMKMETVMLKNILSYLNVASDWALSSHLFYKEKGYWFLGGANSDVSKFFYCLYLLLLFILYMFKVVDLFFFVFSIVFFKIIHMLGFCGYKKSIYFFSFICLTCVYVFSFMFFMSFILWFFLFGVMFWGGMEVLKRMSKELDKKDSSFESLKKVFMDCFFLLLNNIKKFKTNMVYKVVDILFFTYTVFINSPLFSVYCFTWSLFLFLLCLINCGNFYFFYFTSMSFIVLFLSFISLILDGIQDYDLECCNASSGILLSFYLMLCFDGLLYFIMNFCFLYFIFSPNYYTGFGVFVFVYFFLESVWETSFTICFLSIMSCYIIVINSSVFLSKKNMMFFEKNSNCFMFKTTDYLLGFLGYNWVCYLYFFILVVFTCLCMKSYFLTTLGKHLYFWFFFPPFGISAMIWLMVISYLGCLDKEEELKCSEEADVAMKKVEDIVKQSPFGFLLEHMKGENKKKWLSTMLMFLVLSQAYWVVMFFFYMFGVFVFWVMCFFLNGLVGLVFLEVYVLLVLVNLKVKLNICYNMFVFFFVLSFFFVFVLTCEIIINPSYLNMYFNVFFFKVLMGLISVFFIQYLDYFMLFFFVFMSESSLFYVFCFFYKKGDLKTLLDVVMSFDNFFVIFLMLYSFLSIYFVFSLNNGVGLFFCLYNVDSLIVVFSIFYSFEIYVFNFVVNSLVFIILYFCYMYVPGSGGFCSFLFKLVFFLFVLGMPPFPMFFSKSLFFYYFFITKNGLFFFIIIFLYSTFNTLLLSSIILLINNTVCVCKSKKHKSFCFYSVCSMYLFFFMISLFLLIPTIVVL